MPSGWLTMLSVPLDADPGAGAAEDGQGATGRRVERAGHAERVRADGHRDVAVVERAVGPHLQAVTLERADLARRCCVRSDSKMIDVAGLAVGLGTQRRR